MIFRKSTLCTQTISVITGNESKTLCVLKSWILIDVSRIGLPRLVTSRSVEKESGHSPLVSEDIVKLAIVEYAIDSIGRAAATASKSTSSKLDMLLNTDY